MKQQQESQNECLIHLNKLLILDDLFIFGCRAIVFVLNDEVYLAHCRHLNKEIILDVIFIVLYNNRNITPNVFIFIRQIYILSMFSLEQLQCIAFYKLSQFLYF